MRTFDYRRLPQRLLTGAVADANVRLYEDRGKLEAFKLTHGESLAAMREQAHFDNVDASTRLEGLYVDADRTREIIAGAAPIDETEAQIAGLSDALRLFEDSPDDIELSTSTILALYEALYGYRNLGRKSRYRKKDYMYVQVDGHLQALPVSPITAFETPLVLGGAADSLGEAFNADASSPLVLNAVFTVDFLCIRPFDEGNGRISRLFSDLLLMKAGFEVARYSSVDRIMESAGMEYYNALNACVEGWDRGKNDYEPYALYWLEIVHEAYGRLFAALESDASARNLGKTERVRFFVREAAGAVSKREIKAALPDVSEATIEAALGKMVKEGVVAKLGAGRSTSYRWLH